MKKVITGSIFLFALIALTSSAKAQTSIVEIAPPCDFYASVDKVNSARKHHDMAGESLYAVDHNIGTGDLSCKNNVAKASISGVLRVAIKNYGTTCKVKKVGTYTEVSITGENSIKAVYIHMYLDAKVPDGMGGTISARDLHGKAVSVGDVIGAIGDVGCATGKHIHFEVHRGSTQLVHTPYPGQWAYVEPFNIDVTKHPRKIANYKGVAAIIGFGETDVIASGSISAGGGAVVTYPTGLPVLKEFAYSSGGWRMQRHVRTVGDINGDNNDELIGFGDAGVFVSFSRFDQLRFTEPALLLREFGLLAGGWQVNKHPRMVADVNADGKDDIVGFGDNEVLVALSNGNGSFQKTKVGTKEFTYNGGLWRVNRHVRTLADANGDGAADIIGFGEAYVYVALSKRDGTFAPAKAVANFFTYQNGGWRVDKHPRFAADMNNDGRADLVAFGDREVLIAYAQADGKFTYHVQASQSFTYENGQWRVNKHPRMVADVNNDGELDLVGFGDAGMYASYQTSSGQFAPMILVTDQFGYYAGGWK